MSSLSLQLGGQQADHAYVEGGVDAYDQDGRQRHEDSGSSYAGRHSKGRAGRRGRDSLRRGRRAMASMALIDGDSRTADRKVAVAARFAPSVGDHAMLLGVAGNCHAGSGWSGCSGVRVMQLPEHARRSHNRPLPSRGGESDRQPLGGFCVQRERGGRRSDRRRNRKRCGEL